MAVAIVGWAGSIPAEADFSAGRYGTGQLQRALRSGALVVVLGPEVLGTVAPDVAALILDGFGGVTFGIADGVRVERLEAWRTFNLVRLVAPEWLPGEVRRIVEQRPLARLSLYEWLGPEAADLPPRLLAALRELPRLDLLVGDEWAEALGMSPRSLLRLVRGEFPCGPGGLLRDYRLRSARALCRGGRPMAEVAPSVGYSHASSLCRALGDLWPRTPAPGARPGAPGASGLRSADGLRARPLARVLGDGGLRLRTRRTPRTG